MVQGHTASNWQTHMVYSEGPVFPVTVSKVTLSKGQHVVGVHHIFLSIFHTYSSFSLEQRSQSGLLGPAVDVPDPCHVVYAQ